MVLDSGLGTLQRDFVTFAVTAAWVTLHRVDPPYRLTGLSLHHSQLQPLDSCVLFLNLLCLLALFEFSAVKYILLLYGVVNVLHKENTFYVYVQQSLMQGTSKLF